MNLDFAGLVIRSADTGAVLAAVASELRGVAGGVGAVDRKREVRRVVHVDGGVSLVVPDGAALALKALDDVGGAAPREGSVFLYRDLCVGAMLEIDARLLVRTVALVDVDAREHDANGFILAALVFIDNDVAAICRSIEAINLAGVVTVVGFAGAKLAEVVVHRFVRIGTCWRRARKERCRERRDSAEHKGQFCP